MCDILSLNEKFLHAFISNMIPITYVVPWWAILKEISLKLIWL